MALALGCNRDFGPIVTLIEANKGRTVRGGLGGHIADTPLRAEAISLPLLALASLGVAMMFEMVGAVGVEPRADGRRAEPLADQSLTTWFGWSAP